MDPIKISLDPNAYAQKPSGKEIGAISHRIANYPQKIETEEGLRKFVEQVGAQGHTFCPATFSGGKRNQESFQQQQLIALDFDNEDPKKTLTFDEVKSRAEYYDLPILFSYNSMTSRPEHPKFRVVFLNDISIPDRPVAAAMQMALGNIFPEADPSCCRDVSKMYFGGKRLIYYDESMPKINLERIVRSFTAYIKQAKGDKHYKEHIKRFSKKTGIGLTEKGYLNVSLVEDADEFGDQIHPTEASGASNDKKSKNGGISPSPIIYSISDGENPPFSRYYKIEMNGSTSTASVGKDAECGLAAKGRNHRLYRSTVLKENPNVCQLFCEFRNGERHLDHAELFGLMNNLINVESGFALFCATLSRYPQYYDKVEKWKVDGQYSIDQGYLPQRCSGFCPYAETCTHTKNLLTTAHPGRRFLERDKNFHEVYYPLEEVQRDIRDSISMALSPGGSNFTIISAQTGAGKTFSYLSIMAEHPEMRFLIAAPTNLLKDEIYTKAKKAKLAVCKTPSLESYKDDIPSLYWEHIQWLYKIGKSKEVIPYIKEILKRDRCPALQAFINKKEKMRQKHGSMITTHRYMLMMDEERLNEFDVCIIDEDIFFKTIITSQKEIPLSALRKLRKRTPDKLLRKKIEKLLNKAKTQTCIELKSILDSQDISEEDQDVFPYDITQFCLAERFYIRRASVEASIREDTVVFLRPDTFKPMKYIIVSATVNEEICEQFLGDADMEYHECRQAKYVGKLLQYPDRSMSRSSIANDQEVVCRLMHHFGMDENHVITFMNQNIGSLHFGNTEGSNMLEGENILVVGTPYHAPFLYKLVAYSMGFDFDEEAEMTMQLVTHNGYRFWFNTFADENLRLVQFWMIESELEQAIGRARLLRHDCTVHLFSNFPLKQAEMITGFNYDCQ